MIAGSALEHGISAGEIRAVVEYPQFSYGIGPRIDSDAQVCMLVGGAAEIQELFDGAVEFTSVSSQRPQRREGQKDVR